MSHLTNMIQIASDMLTKSYSPYSHFPVGACIRTVNGELFAGCNIENASYPLSLCAEAAAIAQMIVAGHQEIAELVVMGTGSELCAPCGACRQRLREFAKPHVKIHICDPQGIRKTMTMAELLPVSFGPHNLAPSSSLDFQKEKHDEFAK